MREGDGFKVGEQEAARTRNDGPNPISVITAVDSDDEDVLQQAGPLSQS